MKSFVEGIQKFAKDCAHVETPEMSDQCFIAFQTVEDKYKIWNKETNIFYKGLDQVKMVASIFTAYSTCFGKTGLNLQQDKKCEQVKEVFNMSQERLKRVGVKEEDAKKV